MRKYAVTSVDPKCIEEKLGDFEDRIDIISEKIPWFSERVLKQAEQTNLQPMDLK